MLSVSWFGTLAQWLLAEAGGLSRGNTLAMVPPQQCGPQ
jgi:hypothetical protein